MNITLDGRLIKDIDSLRGPRFARFLPRVIAALVRRPKSVGKPSCLIPSSRSVCCNYFLGSARCPRRPKCRTGADRNAEDALAAQAHLARRAPSSATTRPRRPHRPQAMPRLHHRLPLRTLQRPRQPIHRTTSHDEPRGRSQDRQTRQRRLLPPTCAQRL